MNPARDEKRAGVIWGSFIGDALVQILDAMLAGSGLREAIFRHGSDWLSPRKAEQWSREPDDIVIGQRGEAAFAFRPLWSMINDHEREFDADFSRVQPFAAARDRIRTQTGSAHRYLDRPGGSEADHGLRVSQGRRADDSAARP